MGNSASSAAGSPSLKRRNTNDASTFSPEELKMLNHSWKSAKEASNDRIGQILIASFIAQKPDMASWYKISPELPAEQVAHQPNIMEIGRKFVLFFNSLIEAIGTEKLAPIAFDFGAKHYQKHVSFSADLWLHIKRVTVDVILSFSRQNSSLNPDSETAVWNKFVSVVVREMKRGFVDATLNQKHFEADKEITCCYVQI